MRFWLSVRVTSSSSESVELYIADDSAVERNWSLGTDGGLGIRRPGPPLTFTSSAKPVSLATAPLTLGESRRPFRDAGRKLKLLGMPLRAELSAPACELRTASGFPIGTGRRRSCMLCRPVPAPPLRDVFGVPDAMRAAVLARRSELDSSECTAALPSAVLPLALLRRRCGVSSVDASRSIDAPNGPRSASAMIRSSCGPHAAACASVRLAQVRALAGRHYPRVRVASQTG